MVLETWIVRLTRPATVAATDSGPIADDAFHNSGFLMKQWRVRHRVGYCKFGAYVPQRVFARVWSGLNGWISAEIAI